jgi:hypothetical protein
MIGSFPAGEEKAMPYHWRPMKGDNPGPVAREVEVRKIVRKHRGSLVFCGFAEGKAFALIDVTAVEDVVAMDSELGAIGDAIVLETAVEREDP